MKSQGRSVNCWVQTNRNQEEIQKDMKILLLTTHLRMGGIPIYVVTLAAALKQLKNEVTIASSGGELVERLDKNEIPHIGLNINVKSELHPKILAGGCSLIRFIKKNNIDVIHTHTRVTQVMGEMLAFLTGAHHVSTCHGFFKLRVGRKLFKCWGEKVIAISDAVREHLVNDFKVKKSKIALIHNGIDLEPGKKIFSEEQKRAIRKELGLRQGPVVGIIARLSSVKGHKFLVEAMKRVVKDIKDAQLLIVGEGAEEVSLRGQTKELGLSDSVVFAKSISDTAGVLSIMDVFVLSSIKEGLGFVLLEALSCARPVVASDAGGVCSIVEDNTTGLLAPPKDSGSLASAILKLLKDKALAQRLAENGQKLVRENFSLDKMAKKVHDLYKEVLK